VVRSGFTSREWDNEAGSPPPMVPPLSASTPAGLIGAFTGETKEDVERRVRRKYRHENVQKMWGFLCLVVLCATTLAVVWMFVR